MKTKQRIISAVLAFVMCFSCMSSLIAFAAGEVGEEVQKTVVAENEWEEVKSIISQYCAEWTDTSYANAISNRMPFTALLGNGDVGISSDGSNKEKRFHISKGDFWQYNGNPLPVGTISLGTIDNDGNLAKGYKNVTASSVLDSFTPDRAVNGKWSSGGYEGWVSKHRQSEYWLKLEFEEAITFNHWIVRNSSAGRPGSNGLDTKACEIQISQNGSNWTTVSSVSDNAGSVINVRLEEAVTTKWVRLLVTEPHQGTSADAIKNPRARIVSFELYNDKPEDDGYINLTEELKLSGDVVRYNKADMAKAILDGTVVLANIDDQNGTLGYYQTLQGYGPSTFKVRVENDTTVNFVMTCFSKGDRGTYDSIFKNLKINGSTDGVTYTEGRPTFNGWSTQVSLTVATLNLTKGENNISFELGANVNIAGFGFDLPTAFFNEKQDILNAQIMTQQKLCGVPMEIKSWMSATNNLFVMELTSLSEESSSELAINLEGYVGGGRPVTADVGDKYMVVTRATLGANSSDTNSYTSKVALASKIIGVEGTYEQVDDTSTRVSFTLPAGETVYIVTAVGGGGRTYDCNGNLWTDRIEPVTEAINMLSEIEEAGDIETLHNAHLDWWKDYWMQSYISLDTTNEDLALIQKYYYAAQYELACCTRDGKVAPGLYGNWHTDDNAKWKSDYHLNYNFVSTFYGVASSNRVSMLLPAVDAIMDFMPKGMEIAGSTALLKKVKSDFVDRLISLGQVDPVNGIQGGMVFPVGIGPYGMILDANYHNETLNAPFSAYPMIEYYNFTQDEEFMENTLYPYLKAVLTFLQSWLVEEDGKLVLYSGYNEGSWATNAGVELAMYKYCLKYGIAISEKLNVDADKRAAWQEISDRMPAQPTVENYGGIEGNTIFSPSDTYLVDGSFIEDTRGGIIPLESMLPADVFGYYSSDEELRIMQNSLNSFGQSVWTDKNCFPRMATMSTYARCDAQNIVTKFAASIRQLMATNMMINDGTHGVEKAGAIEAVNSMMLLGDKDVIKLFGNWLTDKDAKFTRLRAPGAFVISAEYDGESQQIIEGVTMFSEAGATATVASLWDDGMVVLDGDGNIVETQKGSAPNHDDEITYTFDTEVGETYTFVKHMLAEDGNSLGNGKHYRKCIVEGCDYGVEEACVGSGSCTEDSYCIYCDSFIRKAIGHTEVVDAAVAPTCTDDGRTEGMHCSVCGEITVAPVILPARGHVEVLVEKAVAPTCTDSGHTEYKYCSVCDETIVAKEEIPSIGHDWQDATTESPKTCKNCGATEGDKLPTIDELAKDHSECESNWFAELWNAIVNFFRRLFGKPEKCVCGEEI